MEGGARHPSAGREGGSSNPVSWVRGRTYPPRSPQGFSDERHGDVVVVRPMRDHTLKEVAFYNRLFAVPSVFTPAIDTKVTCRTGQRLPARLRQPKLCPHQPSSFSACHLVPQWRPCPPASLERIQDSPWSWRTGWLVPSRGRGLTRRGSCHTLVPIPGKASCPACGEGWSWTWGRG